MHEDEGQVLNFIAGLAVGTLLGAGVALLLAPQSGRRTRRDIVRAAEDISDTARDTKEDVRKAARDAVRAAERRGARLRESVRATRDRDD